ncbi:MAG: NAD(P)H-dependent oxidoreductase [Oscillospiraceae bacterium]|jgi:chromate reductase|nr:NAD(P)H-dependent oxidoreductase [Oscillospiraceae bacterium]
MDRKTIGIIVGSLRRESYCRKVALRLSELLADAFDTTLLTGGDLPLYNQDSDDDGTPPPQWTAFRDKVAAFDGVLFVTPEYNRSVPAVLKNALDVASRPPARNAWSGKPGGIVSVSPGRLGAFGANNHLRQSAACLNIAVMPTPEGYFGGASDFLGESGAVTDEHTAASLKRYAAAYAAWVKRFTD